MPSSTAEPQALGRFAGVGRYVVLSGLGSGGMGNIFEAYDPELDRKVALKVLRGDLLASETGEAAQARLYREARAAAQLTHPHVVSVYDVGTVGGRVFIAMERIQGATLGIWLKAEKRSWRDVLRIFKQAGQGLAAAHKVGLVHRDFKPSNVMVDTEGRARVLDFGLAKAVGGGSVGAAEPGSPSADGTSRPLAMSLTLTGETPGTPAYMAPEQSLGRTPDARADQFSFCVALYEALYGERPFESRPANAFPGRLRDAPADSPVPGWLRRILLKGLAVEPDERFSTMDSLLAALAADPERRRRRVLAVMAAAAATALGLYGILRIEPDAPLLCQGAERKLAGIWDAGRKADIREAFLATGLAYAPGTWRRVEEELDTYTQSWVTAHREACEATWLRKEQSEELLDRRMACLDGRRQEIRGLTDLLARPGEPVVRHAIQAAGSLRRLEGCADLGALTALLPPPREPDTVEQVRRLRAQLGEMRALHAAGKYPEALELGLTVRAAAVELGYRPLLGEVELELGVVQGRLGERRQLREHFLEAASIAEATQHRELLANALTYLVLSGFVLGEPEASHAWGRLAAGAIEALGGHPEIERQRLLFLGMVANMEQQPETAIDYFETALEIDPECDLGARGAALNNIGAAYVAMHRPQEAILRLHQALKALETFYPPGHPNLAGPIVQLGDLYAQEGQHDEALAHYRRALDLLTAALGPEHPDLAKILKRTGRTRIAQGHPESAVADLERAIQLWEDHPEDPLGLAESRFELARALSLVGGDPHRARDLALQAHETLAGLGERSSDYLAEVETWLRERGWWS